jgi:hypothetical protein
MFAAQTLLEETNRARQQREVACAKWWQVRQVLCRPEPVALEVIRRFQGVIQDRVDTERARLSRCVYGLDAAANATMRFWKNLKRKV